ncbi:hypothetical protein BS47DRAFT_1358216 [Hydnum rufescens UP504]|uniref:Peptidase S9 prolyl oligopeptidase catalytic domain-containing protein n=1 Tax=Hydnum rufescens UP504 TaxID=1448309 RepID=A0A9P6DZB9_9AGAM|nr:hypothetical protein BS47DRAFT_1358216 [Hydnum rufescens UP504]
MTLFPPRPPKGSEVPALSVALKQASFVALVPRLESFNHNEIQWFEGDIYEQSPSPRIIPIHLPLLVSDPIIFDVFISLDYEIRLFGDPVYSDHRPEPVSRTRISIDAISPLRLVVGGPLQLIPDFMDGWALGDVLGVEVQNSSSWQTLQHVRCDQNNVDIKHYPPLVALHGAGVDVDSPFWTNSIPRQQFNWVIYPSGLTPWGYDWRGPSVLDVFASVKALRTREPIIAEQFVAIGHSNGGQGAFFIASRYPDIVPAAIPVAAYLSASAYVPESSSHGSHYVDPTLGGILKASTAGGDNDLFLGNLTRSRMRVFHGGEDENVPVWHSRKAIEIVRSFDRRSDATFEEIPGKPHWWDGTLRTPSIQHAIHDLLHDPQAPRTGDSPFTLTVMWPHESGSLRGWQIRQVDIPGRLSKLTVAGSVVRTANVRCFSVIHHQTPLQAIKKALEIDGHPIGSIPDKEGEIWFLKSSTEGWERIAPRVFRETGPISRILSYGSPITLVVPCRGSNTHDRDLTLARRLAHNLLAYLGIDCDILFDTEATRHPNWSSSSGSRAVVVFGGPFENKYAKAQLEIDSPIEFDSHYPGCFKIHHKKFSTAGTGLLFMWGTHLYICGVDTEGYERAMRAFPLRTGVANPEWLVVGADADKWSTGGILGAGFWDYNGKYSNEMSWLG